MVQKVIIRKPLNEAKSEIEEAIRSSHTLLLKRIDKKGFYLFSRKNYGSMSMIEKEYYKVKGKFNLQGNQTEITYEVNGNSTYRILSIVLPIMMLPTVFLGAAGGDKSNILTVLILYLIMTGAVIFWALHQEKSLKRMGEKDFELILKKVNT